MSELSAIKTIVDAMDLGEAMELANHILEKHAVGKTIWTEADISSMVAEAIEEGRIDEEQEDAVLADTLDNGRFKFLSECTVDHWDGIRAEVDAAIERLEA